MPSITNASGQFVSHAQPVLSMGGSASITTLSQAPGANRAYELLFDIVLSDGSAAEFLNCFTVTGMGENFAATLTDSDTFEGIIADCIDNATLTEAADSGKVTPTPAGDIGLMMNPWFRKRVIDNIKKIYYDQVPNLLQSNWSLTTQVESADGASDLATKLTAAEVETIAQMLPRSNYEEYADVSENTTTSALPLVQQDKLVFVFTSTLDAISRVYNSHVGNTADTTSAGATAGPGADYSTVTNNDYYQNFSTETRDIALRIQMGSGTVGNAIPGLKAAEASTQAAAAEQP